MHGTFFGAVREVTDDAINEVIAKFDLNCIEPLYSSEDAEQSLGDFEGIPYRQEVTVGEGLTSTFYEAGHILGSAMSVIKYRGNGQKRTRCYSGDIGRFTMPILRDPVLDFVEADRDTDQSLASSDFLGSHGFTTIVPRGGQTISV